MAHVLEPPPPAWEDRRLWLAVLASLLLHGLIAALLVFEPWQTRPAASPPPVLAEFIMPETPRPKVEPRPEPRPETRPEPRPEPPPLAALPPPPPAVPQPQRAPIAPDSRAPPAAGSRARSTPPPAAAPAPGGTAPAAPPQPPAVAGNRQAGAPPGAAGPSGPTMSQSESDFFLGQIVAAWVIDRQAPQFKGVQIYGRYQVLPDGMLAAPFGKSDPWDMTAMIEGWDTIARDQRPQVVALRTALETFLRAMRLAQPFAMPPDAAGYPKVMSLNFRIGDF